jgi:hypothetical protein
MARVTTIVTAASGRSQPRARSNRGLAMVAGGSGWSSPAVGRARGARRRTSRRSRAGVAVCRAVCSTTQAKPDAKAPMPSRNGRNTLRFCSRGSSHANGFGGGGADSRMRARTAGSTSDAARRRGARAMSSSRCSSLPSRRISTPTPSATSAATKNSAAMIARCHSHLKR